MTGGMTGLGPQLPRNWYLLGPARRFAPGTVTTHAIASRELVVWRGRDGGAPVVMDAHCAHMGCHLGKAAVLGQSLRCPLHYRMIGADGGFVGHAGTLRQARYPAREFLGGLFVFLGDPDEAWDLGALVLDGNASCHAGEHRFALPWQWLVANGLDIEHLSSVHDRRLLEPPTMTRDGNAMLRIDYRTLPMASGLSDRIMARLAGNGIHGTIRLLAGSMMLVEAEVGRRRTFILLSFLPQPGEMTLIRGIVGVKGRPGLANRLSARVAKLLFKAFLRKDLGVLDGMKWHEPAHAHSPGDGFTQAACAFFRDLPGA